MQAAIRKPRDLRKTRADLPPPTDPPPRPGGPSVTAARPLPAGARLELSVNRRLGTAPAGFFFGARAVGFGVEDPYFDVRYRWSFSDPGWYTRHDTEDLPWGKVYDVDGRTVVVEDGAVPDGRAVRFLGNDRDVAFGPHAVHVFARPGEYVVTCEARRRGHAPLRETLRVAVEDPERVFVGPATICVSAAGDFRGAPPRALHVATFADAVRLARQQASDSVRILFRRGERHATPSGRRDREAARQGHLERLHWGAFGDGPPPVWGPHNVFLEAAQGGEAAIWGLDYEGPYRADDPWGADPRGREALHARGRAFTTVWDCAMRGGDTLITLGRDAADVVVGNVSGTDWHNYGMFANRGIARVGLCGVWLKQNPEAVIGDDVKGEETPPFYQDHAPFRCSALGGPVAFNLCDLRSVGSWAGYYQPCLRIGRSPNRSGPLVEEAVMDRLRGENGGMLGTGNSGERAYPRRYLWDKIYSIHANESGGSGAVFSPGVSGLCYRNVIVVVPDTPRIGGGRIDRWIRRGDPGKTRDMPEIGQMGLRLANCTLVDLRSAAHFDGAMTLWDADDLAAFGFVRVDGNIVYVPNREDPTETHDAPLDLSVMWQVTNDGMRYREDPFAAIFATDPGAAAYYSPLPASPAFADAAGDTVPVDDFFGRVRGAATSRGAIDAALPAVRPVAVSPAEQRSERSTPRTSPPSLPARAGAPARQRPRDAGS
jgi:hypothetical protein